MTGILLNDNLFEQDIRELLMAFYPGESFCLKEQPDMDTYVRGVWNDERTVLTLSFPEGDEVRVEVVPGDRSESKNRVKRAFYRMLEKRTGKSLPWGSLTGIRPTKIALTELNEGRSKSDIFAHMKEAYYCSDEKASLTVEVASREKELLEDLDAAEGYSLYVGIPFCPTTCLYCSFTSFPISQWEGRVGEYLGALYRELDFVAGIMKGRRLDTVYFGGGTPTSLSADALDELITRVEDTFDLSSLREWSVEAGRPDSITREKLKVLRSHGISRISINPQTMKQATLDLIGRRHTVDDVKEKFALAREEGFDNINMDIICGLPEEGLDDVKETLRQIEELSPENLTVHSLAIKRAARLNTMKEAYANLSITNTQEMIDTTAASARRMGLHPYYLYRQKNMAGNFENVGYALPGRECLYNILIMEEQQTIVGCGAGSTTKRLFPEENRVERAENVKNVEQYIGRIDEMIQRKARIL